MYEALFPVGKSFFYFNNKLLRNVESLWVYSISFEKRKKKKTFAELQLYYKVTN